MSVPQIIMIPRLPICSCHRMLRMKVCDTKQCSCLSKPVFTNTCWSFVVYNRLNPELAIGSGNDYAG